MKHIKQGKYPEIESGVTYYTYYFQYNNSDWNYSVRMSQECAWRLSELLKIEIEQMP